MRPLVGLMMPRRLDSSRCSILASEHEEFVQTHRVRKQRAKFTPPQDLNSVRYHETFSSNFFFVLVKLARIACCYLLAAPAICARNATKFPRRGSCRPEDAQRGRPATRSDARVVSRAERIPTAPAAPRPARPRNRKAMPGCQTGRATNPTNGQPASQPFPVAPASPTGHRLTQPTWPRRAGPLRPPPLPASIKPSPLQHRPPPPPARASKPAASPGLRISLELHTLVERSGAAQ